MTDAVFMEQMVDLEYKVVASPTAKRFAQSMGDGRIIGHKCPSCGKVYVPPKGYCPMCVVETTDADEVAIADVGTVASFTVLTPIQYRGQNEKDPYALANILLDGASGTVGQQRIAGVPSDQVRMGMRVKAVWNPPDERAPDDDARGWGLGNAIKHWEPSGESDAPLETYREHML
ncbi:MAG: Zn-ribbon domain-containing OB-fold protein [Actinobacteria bacterium]|nr:Zn-ribbon domain-containing OB-fold protein [Actinomycetota bacterium]